MLNRTWGQKCPTGVHAQQGGRVLRRIPRACSLGPGHYQLMFLAAGLGFLSGKLAHLLLGVTKLSLKPLVLFLLTVLSCSALVPFLSQLLHVFLEPIGEALGEQVEKKDQQVGC